MFARFRLSLPIAWTLILAALLLRAAAPAGWMPVASEGGIRIALCTGVGPQFMTLGKDGTLHKEAPTPVAPRDPCPFALAATQLAYLPDAIELPRPPALLSPLAFPEPTAINAAVRRHPRPPARGPPALV